MLAFSTQFLRPKLTTRKDDTVISITGRPRRNWTGAIRAFGDGCLLRLDDRDDPEFWIEVAIDGDEVQRIAAELKRETEQRGVVRRIKYA